MAIQIPSSPRRNNPLRPPTGDQWPCYICGNGVDTSKAKWIHVHRGGSHAVTEEEAAKLNAAGDAASDVGGHPIGPCCLRKHPELRPYVIEVFG